MDSVRYGDPLAPGRAPRFAAPVAPQVPVEAGLVVETVPDGPGAGPGAGFCGAVVGWDRHSVTLEDRRGRLRGFPWTERGFLIDGITVTLVPPAPGPAGGPGRTASGSVAVAGQRARVARASRILVEGVHDAALVERVWGQDLRIEGVVVEVLEGVDHLAAVVAAFAPGPGRRLGVLVDHLVPGSKETRLVSAVRDPDVLVLGHPYVDVWEAVKPASLGIAAWPRVPRGEPWKDGVCRALGETGGPREMWRRVLAAVDSYTDLEVPLLRAVEELVDFVTAGTDQACGQVSGGGPPG